METNPSIKYFHKVFFGKLYLGWEMNYIFGKEKFGKKPNFFEATILSSIR